MQPADILGDETVALRIVERLVQNAMSMADGAGGKSGLMQCIMLTLDIAPGELLQFLGAEMRHDSDFRQADDSAAQCAQ